MTGEGVQRSCRLGMDVEDLAMAKQAGSEERWVRIHSLWWEDEDSRYRGSSTEYVVDVLNSAMQVGDQD